MAGIPQYNIGLYHKVTKRKNPQAGGAWVNDDKSINIQLNVGVTLTDDPDILITLWPNDRAQGPQAPPPEPQSLSAKEYKERKAASKGFPEQDDDIPF